MPAGAPHHLRERLRLLEPADLAALAASFITLPDVTTDREAARRVLELLLLVPSEWPRAARLIEQLSPGAEPAEALLWRFRLDAAALEPAQRADPRAWEPLLAAARAAAVSDAASATAEALRLAASGVLGAMSAAPHGAGWLVPVLAGRFVLNAAAAERRRPALRAELAPIFEWLDEAAALDAPVAPGLAAEIARADQADRRGDLATCSRALREAWRAHGRPDDLARALAARAELLVQPALHPAADAALSGRSRRPIPRLQVEPPAAPFRGWTAAIVGSAAHAPEAEPPARGAADALNALAIFEQVGSLGRAARGWLARADLASLKQAARLSDHLEAPERQRLHAALAHLAGDDELPLATDELAREAAVAAWWTAPGETERDLWRARLSALAWPADAAAQAEARTAAHTDADVAAEAKVDGEEPPAASPPPARPPEDDPHSFTSRIAAAADLVAAERLEAAATVLASLLRRAPRGPEATRAARLAVEILEREEAPAELIETVTRHLRHWDHVSVALFKALVDAPAAAYPFHEALLELGLDVSRGDHHRLLAWTSWLGIWRATETAPSGELLTALPPDDEALLPLAAARLSGTADPVGAARVFMAAHPLVATDMDAYSDALLAASL